MRKSLLKKIIATGMILLIVLTLIACQSNDDDLYDSAIYQGLEHAELSFLFPGTEPSDMKAVIEKLEKELDYLKISLDFKFVPWKDYGAAVTNYIASDASLDVFCYADYEGMDLLKEWGADNSIKDISELFPVYAPNYYSKFTQEELMDGSRDGKLYAIGNKLPTSNKICAYIPSYLVEKYNIKEMKDYKDVENYLGQICTNEPDLLNLCIYNTSIGLFAEAYGYVIFDYELGIVYKWNDPEMKLMAWEQTPEFKDAIKRLYLWVQKGYLKPSIGVVRPGNAIEATGKWGCILADMGSSLYLNEKLYEKEIKDWHFIGYPLFPYAVSTRMSSTNDGAFVFASKSQSTERALMFIDKIESVQEYYDMMMYGIKGKNYVLKKEQVDYPKESKEEQRFMLWGGSGAFFNMDLHRDTVLSAIKMEDYRDVIKNTTKYAPHWGFRSDYNEVQAEVSYRKTNYYRLEQKMMVGTFSEKEIDVYIEEQRSHAETLIDAVQEQLDAWKARK